jgi:hypothetical protein
MPDQPAQSDASRAAICHGLRTLITLLGAVGEHSAAAYVGTALDIVDRPRSDALPD